MFPWALQGPAPGAAFRMKPIERMAFHAASSLRRRLNYHARWYQPLHSARTRLHPAQYNFRPFRFAEQRAHNRCSGFTPLTPAMRQIEPKKPARWLDWSTWPSTASPSACDVNAKRQRPPPPPLTADIATTTVAGATIIVAAARVSASTTCLLRHGTSSAACVRRYRQRLPQHGRHRHRQRRLVRAAAHTRNCSP